MNFPEADLDNIPILYLNSYITQDSELQFGIFEQNGKQYFVIDNNLNHIRKFASYLSLKYSIEQDNLLDKLDKETKEILESCRKSSNYNSIQQMVLEYLNNKDLFRQYRTKDNKSVFSLLNSTLSIISSEVRTRNFNNPTANEFYQRLNKSSKNTWTIDLKELYEQVLMYDDIIKQVIPDTLKNF